MSFASQNWTTHSNIFQVNIVWRPIQPLGEHSSTTHFTSRSDLYLYGITLRSELPPQAQSKKWAPCTYSVHTFYLLREVNIFLLLSYSHLNSELPLPTHLCVVNSLYLLTSVVNSLYLLTSEKWTPCTYSHLSSELPLSTHLWAMNSICAYSSLRNELHVHVPFQLLELNLHYKLTSE